MSPGERVGGERGGAGRGRSWMFCCWILLSSMARLLPVVKSLAKVTSDAESPDFLILLLRARRTAARSAEETGRLSEQNFLSSSCSS